MRSLPRSARSLSSSRPFPGIAQTACAAMVAATGTLLAPAAHAQFAISAGVDGGLTFPDAPIDLVDPDASQDSPDLGPALGIDVAAYYLFEREVGLGLALSPTFYTAGPEPSPGINFAVGPRLVLRPDWYHISLDAGFVLSTFEDACSSDSLDADCPQTRQARAVAPGFGAALATLSRVHQSGGLDLLLGPAVRYQWARYSYEDGEDAYSQQVWQALFVFRAFVDFSSDDPS